MTAILELAADEEHCIALQSGLTVSDRLPLRTQVAYAEALILWHAIRGLHCDVEVPEAVLRPERHMSEAFVWLFGTIQIPETVAVRRTK
jgi:hypothetical protein